MAEVRWGVNGIIAKILGAPLNFLLYLDERRRQERCRLEQSRDDSRPALHYSDGFCWGLDAAEELWPCVGLWDTPGVHQAQEILVSGLRRLEYRGYDSAGVATLDGDELWMRKRAGRVRSLEELLEQDPVPGNCGISHTRWATHGPATDRNAHPHLGGRAKGPTWPWCTTV